MGPKFDGEHLHNLPSVSLTSSFFFYYANFFVHFGALFSIFWTNICNIVCLPNKRQQFPLFVIPQKFVATYTGESVKKWTLLNGSGGEIKREQSTQCQHQQGKNSPSPPWPLCFVCFLELSHISGRSLSLVLWALWDQIRGTRHEDLQQWRLVKSSEPDLLIIINYQLIIVGEVVYWRCD